MLSHPKALTLPRGRSPTRACSRALGPDMLECLPAHLAAHARVPASQPTSQPMPSQPMLECLPAHLAAHALAAHLAAPPLPGPGAHPSPRTPFRSCSACPSAAAAPAVPVPQQLQRPLRPSLSSCSACCVRPCASSSHTSSRHAGREWGSHVRARSTNPRACVGQQQARDRRAWG